LPEVDPLALAKTFHLDEITRLNDIRPDLFPIPDGRWGHPESYPAS
jgi:hypothetical protein